MRKLLLCVLLLAIMLPVAAAAETDQPLRRHGLGVMAGTPTGLIFTYMTNEVQGLDVGVGWDVTQAGDIYFRTDYQHHFFPFDEDNWRENPWTVYPGIGVRLRFIEDDDDDAGLRFPFGTTLRTGSFPVDFFAEVAPVLVLIPTREFDWDWSVGIRGWF